jgi:hypothetical protein
MTPAGKALIGVASGLAVLVLVISLLEINSQNGPSLYCVGRAPSQSSASSVGEFSGAGSTDANAPSTTLPPSHDNDAGISRAPDVTPDADADTYQRPRICFEHGKRLVVP